VYLKFTLSLFENCYQCTKMMKAFIYFCMSLSRTTENDPDNDVCGTPAKRLLPNIMHYNDSS